MHASVSVGLQLQSELALLFRHRYPNCCYLPKMLVCSTQLLLSIVAISLDIYLGNSWSVLCFSVWGCGEMAGLGRYRGLQTPREGGYTPAHLPSCYLLLALACSWQPKKPIRASKPAGNQPQEWGKQPTASLAGWVSPCRHTRAEAGGEKGWNSIAGRETDGDTAPALMLHDVCFALLSDLTLSSWEQWPTVSQEWVSSSSLW